MSWQRGRWRWVLLLAACVLQALAAGACAADKVLDVGRVDQDSVSLTEYFSVLEDLTTRMTFDEVRRADVAASFAGGLPAADSFGFGLTQSAIWLRLSLRNSSAQPVERLLEIANARLSHLQLYQPGHDGGFVPIMTGNALPFATRPYKHRHFVFPVIVPPGAENTYYMRLQSGPGLVVPASLWKVRAFQSHAQSDYLGQAWYLGMASAMILFNLLLFLALRDVLYVFYVVFAFSASFGIAAQSGLINEYLSGFDQLALDGAPTNAAFAIAVAALVSFMRAMLSTACMLPRFDQVLRALVGFYLLVPIGFFIAFQPVSRIVNISYLMTLTAIVGVATYCALIKRQRSAIFFLAAFVVFCVAGVINTLRVFGLVTTSAATTNALAYGSAIEMLVLAFALADRFNLIRKEKSLAQEQAIEAQQRLVDALKSSERILEERVEQRTAALLESNAALSVANQVAETARQRATQALQELKTSQAQLIQSEKMASLGQLVANVAHEVNTPIGAVKSSGTNIIDAINQVLDNLPRFHKLDQDMRLYFMKLVSHGREVPELLTTREERELRRDTTRRLEEAGIGDAAQKADILVQMRAQSAVADYLPLLRHPECDIVLSTAFGMSTIISSTRNINSAVNRVAKIIFALKSFSRSSSNGEMLVADLREGIETVLTIYQGQFKRGVELVCRYDDIPPIRCLPDELNQVWTNLIHNALQSMDYTGTLTVCLYRQGDDAVISVGDTGCGIAEDIRGKIFDAFFTTKPVGEGSGLGLDIVWKIVERHRGRIDFNSQVGVGTTFFVYLPVTSLAD